jgi:hypothetical protein
VVGAGFARLSFVRNLLLVQAGKVTFSVYVIRLIVFLCSTLLHERKKRKKPQFLHMNDLLHVVRAFQIQTVSSDFSYDYLLKVL